MLDSSETIVVRISMSAKSVEALRDMLRSQSTDQLRDLLAETPGYSHLASFARDELDRRECKCSGNGKDVSKESLKKFNSMLKRGPRL